MGAHKQVEWTYEVYESFAKEAMLTDEERYLMESRMKDIPVSIQAYTLGLSVGSVHNRIRKIKKKYDIVQKAHPDKYPVRKKGKTERWLDRN